VDVIVLRVIDKESGQAILSGAVGTKDALDDRLRPVTIRGEEADQLELAETYVCRAIGESEKGSSRGFFRGQNLVVEVVLADDEVGQKEFDLSKPVLRAEQQRNHDRQSRNVARA
jgi:hypothetical protein